MFTKKYDRFWVFNKKKKDLMNCKYDDRMNSKLFCLKRKFWECSCCKRTKVQLFKETCISRKKCCFNF